MKRYRVLTVDFDTRANMLNTEIQDSWKPEVKAQWQENHRLIREGLIHQFGVESYQTKIDNFVYLGSAPISLISFHNSFLRQCRNAFVVGSYYPALVSACTLGERILNRLMISLRNHFKNTPEYKKIHRKKSFDDWKIAIQTLEGWNVLLPNVTTKFEQLEKLRHRSIHFNPEIETDVREPAGEAVILLQEIVKEQFSALGPQPWYINGTPGGAYVKKEYEEHPFVREVVLPNCELVGPNHRLEHRSQGWVLHDSDEYSNKEVSDEEFARMISGQRT